MRGHTDVARFAENWGAERRIMHANHVSVASHQRVGCGQSAGVAKHAVSPPCAGTEDACHGRLVAGIGASYVLSPGRAACGGTPDSARTSANRTSASFFVIG